MAIPWGAIANWFGNRTAEELGINTAPVEPEPEPDFSTLDKAEILGLLVNGASNIELMRAIYETSGIKTKKKHVVKLRALFQEAVDAKIAELG